MPSQTMVTGQSVISASDDQRDIRGRDRDYSDALWKSRPNLLDLSYGELEAKNLEIKKERKNGATSGSLRDGLLNYLRGEDGIKAVTVCFTDLEGRFQTLDYDKNHLISSEENLTFDGSSIKGFTPQNQSDLRLKIDWTSFRWVPSDMFGPGKVLVFANVCDQDGSLYVSDFRSSLYKLCDQLRSEKGIIVNIAPEIEGFLFKGPKAEQTFDKARGFELATMSGYFNSLPQDTLRMFMDKFAEVQRALGFENEKDHPEVAPAQFELNFKYSVALDTADQIQLYKLFARQIARAMGLTASFLPKPIQGLNGSGMHTNISLSKDGVNMFYDANGKYNLSDTADKFVTGILRYANELCLVMNPSVNAYRRLDPAYEAPNEIKVSSVDRGSMIRIPIGNENSARVEVRTVAPDVNPYLCFYALVKAGLKGIESDDSEYSQMKSSLTFEDGSCAKLPSDIYGALEHFEGSDFMSDILGDSTVSKYSGLKRRAANRCPRDLGKKIKSSEVLYHHEVTNQLLWNDF